MLKRDDMILRGRYNISNQYINIKDINEVNDYIRMWQNKESCDVSLLINCDIIIKMDNIIKVNTSYEVEYGEEVIYKYFIKNNIMILLIYVAPDIYEIQCIKVMS